MKFLKPLLALLFLTTLLTVPGRAEVTLLSAGSIPFGDTRDTWNTGFQLKLTHSDGGQCGRCSATERGICSRFGSVLGWMRHSPDGPGILELNGREMRVEAIRGQDDLFSAGITYQMPTVITIGDREALRLTGEALLAYRDQREVLVSGSYSTPQYALTRIRRIAAASGFLGGIGLGLESRFFKPVVPSLSVDAFFGNGAPLVYLNIGIRLLPN